MPSISKWIEFVVTIVGAVLTSSGLWALLMRRQDRKNGNTKMIVGLAHDRILSLGMEYIERGYITRDEYENLYEYLYHPYLALGGNGAVKRVMAEVDKLPIRQSAPTSEGVKNEDEQSGV